MKKLLLTLTILLSAGLLVNQAQAQSNTGFGIRGGVNFANFNDIDGDTESRTGLMGGIYTSFLIPNSPVAIQPEVLYTQKGAESGDNTFELDYIEIPVLARFDFITDGGITPHVYFGPYLGFNVSAEYDGNNDDDPIFGDAETNIEDQVNSTDVGVVVGGGLDFGRVNLGVRYGAGLTEVFEDGGSAKNGVFSVIAGIGF